MVVEYAHDVGYLETSSMAEKIGSALELDDQQRNQLQNIIGNVQAKPTKSTKAARSTKPTQSESSRRR